MELPHIDTKKLGRTVRPSHRVPGNCKSSADGAGWAMLFVGVDDHVRRAFTAMHPDETKAQVVTFLRNAIAYYAKLDVTVKRPLGSMPSRVGRGSWTFGGSGGRERVSRQARSSRHGPDPLAALPAPARRAAATALVRAPVHCLLARRRHQRAAAVQTHPPADLLPALAGQLLAGWLL